jgi:hypothetical protein
LKVTAARLGGALALHQRKIVFVVIPISSAITQIRRRPGVDRRREEPRFCQSSQLDRTTIGQLDRVQPALAAILVRVGSGDHGDLEICVNEICVNELGGVNSSSGPHCGTCR